MGIAIGQRVADYKVLGVLGSGSLGCVYRVCNVISGRTEAMKVLLANVPAGPDAAERFRGEIKTLAGLRHPNIVQLHTALENGSELLMIMELVEGCTLQQLAQQAPLEPHTAASYIQQVLTALSYAHSRGVVHRAIRPPNIMIAAQGVVKLTDFAIARPMAIGQLALPGTNHGSRTYMSPEQTLGNGTIDARSDIYSVGATLYELLTGKLPFADESANEGLLRQDAMPRAPIEINPQLSQPLSDLIMKALEKDPVRRFQTTGEFSDRLGEVTGVAASDAVLIAGGFFEQGTALAGGTRIWVSPDEASKTETKRNRWSIAAALVTVLACTALMAVGVSAYVKGGLTAKNSDRSMTDSSELPTAAADEIVLDMDHPLLDGLPPRATTVQESEMGIASVPPEEAAIAEPSTSPARAEAPAVHRTADRFAVPPGRRSNAGADLAKAEAGTLETAADKPVVPAPTTLELQEVRRQQEALEPRANAIRSKMTHLRDQKIADGHDLNQGMADAYVDMNLALRAGSAELESGNASAARSHVTTAAHEVNVLEKLFSENP